MMYRLQPFLWLLRGGFWRKRGLSRLRAKRLRTRLRQRPDLSAKLAVVIAMLEHMGDVVSVEPIIREVRRRHPESHLVFAVKPVWRDLVAAHPDVDEVLDVACLGDWIFLAADQIFDQVYDLQTRGRWCSTTELFHERPDVAADVDIHNYYHRGTLLDAALASGGLDGIAVDLQPILHLSAAAHERAEAVSPGKPFVVIHTQSNQASRNWNVHGWRQLVLHLREQHGLEVVLIGMPDESTTPTGVLDLRGKLKVDETAAVIAAATLFVGIDSGPAHIANAVSTPGVVILGVYGKYDRYMPFTGGYGSGSTGTVLHHTASAAETPADVVLAAVDDRIASSPRGG